MGCVRIIPNVDIKSRKREQVYMKLEYELRSDKTKYRMFDYRLPICEPHFHNAIEIIFMTKGKVRVIIDGDSKVLEEGDALFVNSFSVHVYDPLEEDTMAYIIVAEKNYFKTFFEISENKVPQVFFTFHNRELLKNLFDCYHKTQTKDQEICIFSGIISILMAEISKTAKLIKKEIGDSSLICKLLQYIQENIKDNITLKSIAKKFGYTEAYLSRVFNKYLGESLCTYINQSRVFIADEIIKNEPNKNIIDIAFECGFNSPQTFYRVYTKFFGASPREINVKK